MTVEVTNQVRIQSDREYWYTVEDENVEVGGGVCTIAYHEAYKSYHTQLGPSEDEAVEIAKAIQKLFPHRF
jgi:hypothetical protein